MTTATAAQNPVFDLAASLGATIVFGYTVKPRGQEATRVVPVRATPVARRTSQAGNHSVLCLNTQGQFRSYSDSKVQPLL